MDFVTLERRILGGPNYEHGQGVSDTEIAYAEQLLGHIHGGYRSFLLRFGWLRASTFEIYGLGGDVPRHLNLIDITLSERTEMHPRLRNNLVPVMNDGAGNLYCVDTQNSCSNVVFWNHDLDADQEPEPTLLSFEEWLYEQLENAANLNS